MARLATVLLRHETPSGGHFDWMLATPGGSPGAGLWTVRTDLAAAAWRGAGRWRLTRIADHRRQYLAYQGPLTGGRGSVRRVDAGWVRPWLWRSDEMIFDLMMSHCRGRVRVEQADADCWTAHWLEG